ncbi:hypothetical protein QQP08_008135 [Theobroma cacao]|nr:hypothetical protein QQP08_008135 [Theobroma cacao]
MKKAQRRRLRHVFGGLLPDFITGGVTDVYIRAVCVFYSMLTLYGRYAYLIYSKHPLIILILYVNNFTNKKD